MQIAFEKRPLPEGSSLHDVIISGAGPVGLFLACELALAKCSVLILERAAHAHSALKQLPFGIRGLSAPTIEAFYRRGLLKELEVHKHLKNPHKTSASEQGPARQGGHFAGIPFLDGNIDTSQWPHRLPSSTDTHLLSEMAELESVLTRRAECLGVEIMRGLVVTDFQQTKDDVIVHSGERSFRGQWFVGCDGSRSVIRKIGGFDLAGTEPEFTGYSAQVDIADPEKLQSGRNMTARGVYFQSQPGYLVMVEFDGGAAHSSEPATRMNVQEVLRRVSNTDVTISALHAVTTWTDRARQATTYRSGRVFLAGDAAHIHSPLGGQGLNLGIGDAMNLGWKLAAAIRENAPRDLLDTYSTERHPIGAKVLDWSRAQVAVMKPDPASRALHAILRDLMHSRDGATYFAGRVWGVSPNHNLGTDESLSGYSVPNFEFEDGSTVGEHMHVGKAILLDFEENALLKSLVTEYGKQLTYVSGRAKEQLGLSALLIRPDGMIVWSSNNRPDCSAIREAAARWFLPDPGIPATKPTDDP